LKAPHEKFPEEAIRDAGYGAVWHGQKSWNGVAILARGTTPVELGRALPGDPEDVQSRYIEAMVGRLMGLYEGLCSHRLQHQAFQWNRDGISGRPLREAE